MSVLTPIRSAASDPPGARPRGGRVSRIAPYGFLLPAIVLFAAFFAAPAGYAAYLSLRASTVAGGGIGVRRERFVGLDRYSEVLHDSEFWSGLARMLMYAAIVVPVMLGLALLFALLLDSTYARAVRFSRISIFLPYAIPTVVATLLWGFLYLPTTSPLNDLLGSVGLGSFDPLAGGKDLLRRLERRGVGRHRLQHARALHQPARDPR